MNDYYLRATIPRGAKILEMRCFCFSVFFDFDSFERTSFYLHCSWMDGWKDGRMALFAKIVQCLIG